MSDGPGPDLGPRLAAGLAAARDPASGARDDRGGMGPVVVGFSGGVDSFVLLHLALHDPALRTALAGPGETPRVVAAHLDHAMREDSASAAVALAEWAEAEGVDLRVRRLARAPTSEGEARAARYAFLADIAEEVGALMVWTAHHAEDQIETILFRILRGTGVAGLSGIPAVRGRVVRPFLLAEPPIRRGELEAYAEARRLPVQEDPTNAEPGHASRNRLRHEVLPVLEAAAPGLSERLLRLGRNAERAAAGEEAAVAWILDRVGASAPSEGEGEASTSLPASLWAEGSRPLRRALLRGMARRLGVILSEAATEAALALAPGAQSGRGVDLPGGLRFERAFDVWTLLRRGRADRPRGGVHPPDPDVPDQVTIDRPEPGRATFAPGGERSCRLRWEPVEEAPGPDSAADVPSPGRVAGASSEDSSPVPWRVAIPLAPGAFPLVARGWRAGDRMARPFGTMSLAKAWSEARVPRRARPGRVVILDREGTVLAAEGLGRARPHPTVNGMDARPETGQSLLLLHLEPDE